MLDADEAAGFDEAMRHDPELRSAYQEMACLATAVAVVTTVPIAPRAGQLERLQERLGLNPSKGTNWFGISGWAAAAVLTMALVLDRDPATVHQLAKNRPDGSAASPPSPPQIATPGSPADRDGPDVADLQKGDLPDTSAASDGKGYAKVETRRLIQEIEVLRDKLENFQERDRQRFEAVAGMAWPIVMRMVPPGTTGETAGGLALSKDGPPLAAMLGDALAGADLASGTTVLRAGELAAPDADPLAIPIYDAARDTGTLVVSNLSADPTVRRYLWVKTQEGGSPVYVGELPATNNQGADSFDFSLGATGIVPAGFLLTEGGAGEPVPPSADNTILQGPN